MARWRYATEGEVEILNSTSPANNPESPLCDILPIIRGTVAGCDGAEIAVPGGRVAKLLATDGGEPWVYRVVEMEVLFGQKPVHLRRGTRVAIFQMPATCSQPSTPYSERKETSDSEPQS